jgi:hypothetical protein
MVNRMPIESPALMVSISIKGDCYVNFNLMVFSSLDHLELHIFKLDYRRGLTSLICEV